MITIAIFTKSIWALVFGNLVSILTRTILSYTMFSGHRYFKLHWEKNAADEIIKFGRWIVFASAFNFFAFKSQTLILGLTLPLDELGIYTVAATLAAFPDLIGNLFFQKILLPTYRKFFNKNEFEKAKALRFKFICIFSISCLTLSIAGSWLVEHLYDDRYAAAGWMLQFLALGKIGSILSNSANPMLTAKGDSKSHMKNQLFCAVISISVLLTAMNYSSMENVILISSMIPVLQYFSITQFLRKHNLHILKKDVAFLILYIGFALLFWHFFSTPGIEKLEALFSGINV